MLRLVLVGLGQDLTGCLNKLLCFRPTGNIGLLHFEEQSSQC